MAEPTPHDTHKTLLIEKLQASTIQDGKKKLIIGLLKLYPSKRNLATRGLIWSNLHPLASGLSHQAHKALVEDFLTLFQAYLESNNIDAEQTIEDQVWTHMTHDILSPGAFPFEDQLLRIRTAFLATLEAEDKLSARLNWGKPDLLDIQYAQYVRGQNYLAYREFISVIEPRPSINGKKQIIAEDFYQQAAVLVDTLLLSQFPCADLTRAANAHPQLLAFTITKLNSATKTSLISLALASDRDLTEIATLIQQLLDMGVKPCVQDVGCIMAIQALNELNRHPLITLLEQIQNGEVTSTKDLRQYSAGMQETLLREIIQVSSYSIKARLNMLNKLLNLDNVTLEPNMQRFLKQIIFAHETGLKLADKIRFLDQLTQNGGLRFNSRELHMLQGWRSQTVLRGDIHPTYQRLELIAAFDGYLAKRYQSTSGCTIGFFSNAKLRESKLVAAKQIRNNLARQQPPFQGLDDQQIKVADQGCFSKLSDLCNKAHKIDARVLGQEVPSAMHVEGQTQELPVATPLH